MYIIAIYICYIFSCLELISDLLYFFFLLVQGFLCRNEMLLSFFPLTTW